MRIGLLSDTHMPGSTRELWPQLRSAFTGVDCILHGGDIHTSGVLDALQTLAPLYVARGNGDHQLDDARVQDTWLLEFGGIRTGLVHELPTPGNKSPALIGQRIDQLFPSGRPQVLIYGHTHREAIDAVGDVLCVNPGSPTLPRNQSLRYGTIGFMDISQGAVAISLHQLSEAGSHEIARWQQAVRPA